MVVSSDMPFQTRAMREIERLQKATVYRNTVIKVSHRVPTFIVSTTEGRVGGGELFVENDPV